jgi:hypothetical protein|tara:strand:+ start:682 stop:879 length:198 start_codon:yes stop_codon:yes gene_type:complete
MSYLLEALAKKLEGQVAVAEANILAYTRNPVGIGEHSEIVEAIEVEVAKIAEAEDKLGVIKRHFS